MSDAGDVRLEAFLDVLGVLTLDDVRALSLDIDGLTTTPADEIVLTHAFLHIETTLRQRRRTREAAIAGHRASQAVVDAAARGGAALPDDAVTRVARWAATIARGIVADVDAVADVLVFGHACEHHDELAGVLALTAS